MRLRGKFTLSFGILLLFMALLVGWSLVGTGMMINDSHEMIQSQQLRSSFKQRLVEHLEWAQGVTQYLLIDQGGAVPVETDPELCGLGRWYSSDERSAAEEAVPALSSLLEEMDDPHRRLHRSAEKLEGALSSGDSESAGKIFFNESLPALETLQSLMGRIDSTIEEALVTDTVLLERAWMIRLTALGLGVGALLFGLIVAILLTRSLLAALYGAIDFTGELAGGNLTGKLTLANRDELGDMARALNKMTSQLYQMIGEIRHNSDSLLASAQQLTGTSDKLSAGSARTAEGSTNISAAAEELTVNTQEVASSMEQTAGNLVHVASAAEEMRATVEELSRNTARGREVSSSAVRDTREILERVDRLGDSAGKIGKVTETIAEISAQTNLLALNATIEAARAGAAGRGFGVVANEIKGLAGQTAQSTEAIQELIQEIQESAIGAVTDIRRMGEVVGSVDEIVTTIAAAVEEQAATTRDIAENIAQASEGVQESSERVSQNGEVTQSITSDISELVTHIDEISRESGGVNTKAQGLSGIADELNRTVQFFQLEKE